MTGYIDACLRITDPLDDSRLFDIAGDPGIAESFLQNVMPAGAGGRCIVAPPLYYLLAAGIGDVRAVNDFILEKCAGSPQIIAGLGTIEPKYGDPAEAELERLAAAGACGVVWSPRAQGIMGDDHTLGHLHRRAHELGLVSVYRSEPYSLNEALWRGWVLARQCPEASLLISGGLTSWDNVQMIRGFDGGPANVFYDTAMFARTVNLAELVSTIGPERFVFATGGAEPADRAASRLEAQLRAGGAENDCINAILRTNAVRLFRLGEDGL